MKAWYWSKTVLVNAGVIGLAYWFRWSDFYVDPMWFVWAIAAANIALRFATRAPLAVRRQAGDDSRGT